MQPDMIQRIRRLQQRAAQLGQLASDLASAAPQRSEGCDASGSVLVVLGSDGLPIEIRVRDRWQERLQPEELGAAVIDAANDAVQAATRTLTEKLDDSRWWRRQRDADEGAWEETPRAGDAPAGPTPGWPQVDGEFNERVLSALQESMNIASRPRPTIDAEGTDDGHHVAVKLGAGGLVECFIEVSWARSRAGSAVTAALSAALQRARQKLTSATRQENNVDTLVRDALATLNAFVQRPTSRGDH